MKITYKNIDHLKNKIIKQYNNNQTNNVKNKFKARQVLHVKTQLHNTGENIASFFSNELCLKVVFLIKYSIYFS